MPTKRKLSRKCRPGETEWQDQLVHKCVRVLYNKVFNADRVAGFRDLAVTASACSPDREGNHNGQCPRTFSADPADPAAFSRDVPGFKISAVSPKGSVLSVSETDHSGLKENLDHRQVHQ